MEKEPQKTVEYVIKGMLLNCERNLIQGKFYEPFEVRVKKAWKEFEKRELEYRNTLKRNPRKWSEISNQVQSIFGLGIEDIIVYADNDAGNFEIMFQGDGNPLRLFELQYIKDHAPKTVKQNWNIYIDIPNRLDLNSPKQTKSESNHIYLWLDKEKDGILSFGAFCDGFDPSRYEPLSSDIEYVGDWVADVVGRFVYDKYLKISKTSTTSPSVQTFLLKELPDFLGKKGINIDEGTSNILNTPFKYSRSIPEVLKDQQYRDDILSGTTLCMKALMEYDDCDVDNWENMEADGVAWGCIFYKLDIFTGEDREGQIEQFRKALIQELNEKAGSNAVKIIGEAHGRDFDYIDILAWNPEQVFKVAQNYFKTTSVPFSGYHPMRRDCGSILLTGENRWIEPHSVDSDPTINPCLDNSENKNMQ